MGLFGFGKNKEEKQKAKQQEEINKKVMSGLGVNNVGSTGKAPSKKENNQAYVNQTRTSADRSTIIDGLNSISDELYNSGADQKLVDRTVKIAELVARLNLDSGVITTSTIMGFLQGQVNQIVQFCHSGDLFLVGEALNRLNQLVLEMEDVKTSGPLFSDASYVEKRIQLETLQGEKASYQRDLNTVKANKQDLLDNSDSYDDEEFAMKAQEYNDEEEAAKANMSNLTQDISTLRLALSKQKDQIIRDAKTRQDIARGVVETAETQKALDQSGLDKEMDKARDTLKQNNRHQSVSNMHVDSSSTSSGTQMSKEDRAKMLGLK